MLQPLRSVTSEAEIPLSAFSFVILAEVIVVAGDSIFKLSAVGDGAEKVGFTTATVVDEDVFEAAKLVTTEEAVVAFFTVSRFTGAVCC